MHIRKLLVVVLVLGLLAPFALANGKNETTCDYTASLCISNHFKVVCGCETLTFPEDAKGAETTGKFYTDPCILSVEANKDVSMHIKMTQLTATVDSKTYTLPTDFTYRYKQDGLGWSDWFEKWAPFDCLTLNFAHVNHKGYVWLQFKLSVVRSGLADHFGDYSCGITITVSGC